MNENGYVNKYEKKARNNSNTCECNIVKMAVQISEKTFYYSNK